jgi:hypothetical protein
MSTPLDNFLVLIHSTFTGDVVRQIVVNATDANDAVHKVADKIDSAEHAIAIPTGSEPDDEPAASAMEESDSEVSSKLSDVPEPVDLSAEGIAEPEDAKDMIVEELRALPADLLSRILNAVRDVSK